MNVSVFGSLYAQVVKFLVINVVISNIQMEDTCQAGSEKVSVGKMQIKG